ncbi:MAG TPA: aminodeoxychorismate synthase component I [Pseudonocardiaceae bacterium]
MRTLLVDNYDSFTYNVFHLLAEVNNAEPIVLRNDEEAAWQRLNFNDIANIVISPGPGRPDRERDFGISRLALARHDLPLLGICLGHQGLCHFAGGTVAHAPTPVHGRLSAVHHAGTDLFAGIPSPFQVVRYHSLIAQELPDDLETTAVTADGLVMAVRHRRHRQWGVQFHPESVASEHGARLFGNFRDLSTRPATSRTIVTTKPADRRDTGYRVHVEPVTAMPNGTAVFEALFADHRAAFWLDGDGGSRFSVLGAACGPLGELVSYRVSTGRVVVEYPDGEPKSEHQESLFDYLERELAARRVPDAGLPCDFSLGYVGYLGYELKADCGATAAHRSPLPDGSVVFADRAVVIDHETGAGWLLALGRHPASDRDARAWLRRAGRRLARLPADTETPPLAPSRPIDHRTHHDLDRYRELVLECQRLIGDGESYEICLTNEIRAPLALDPFRTYQILRQVNPAPYAAYLALPSCAVLSSSPERFLRIGRTGAVESKPIKGTRPRGTDVDEDAALAHDLRTAEKDRAENLMIVDLVRNDLGRSAELGSVHVPALFDVESYPTVHQLVSTVRARLRADVSPVACVRAAFPGGSMTGAPKLRAMEIIDRLEDRARGVYAGALGYFSLNGTVDLSIVIRTLVVCDGVATIGAGGAIVAQSDPDDEVEETLVKARALLDVLAIAAAEHQIGTETRPSAEPVTVIHG